ncbi:MAG TPA: M20/M25/M40 family metallo-hydrolase, partial [Citricoccus sp.]
MPEQPDPDLISRVSAAVDALMPEAISTLADLVAIPGIAWDSFDREPLERSAHTVAGLVRGLGLEDVEVLSEDGGGPAVVGRRPAAPGRPTVLLYAHHDVQPVGDRALWHTDPFTAVERDGRLFGRGAADDKAGILVHLTACRALLDAGADTGVGVTFFIEGEEEAGSPTFRAFLEAHREKLAADVIVVADSGNWKVGVPALTTSL